MDNTFYDKLKTHSYIITPMEIIEQYPDLSKDAKFCYLYLIKYASISITNGNVRNGIPLVFLSRESLGELMGVHRNTVARYLSELLQANLISITHRGQGQTDIIEVYTPADSCSCNENGASRCTTDSAQDIIESNIQYTPSDMGDSATTSPVDEVREVVKKIEDRKPIPKIKNTEFAEKEVKDKKIKINTNTILRDFGNHVHYELKVPTPLVSGKERSLISKMVEHYGAEQVKEAVLWVVDNWEEIKRLKRLDGVPTIGLIWGYREYIMANCITKKEEGGELTW